MSKAVRGTIELTPYDTQVQKREMLNMLTEQALADARDCDSCHYLKGVRQHRTLLEQPQALHTGSCTQQGRWDAGTC